MTAAANIQNVKTRLQDCFSAVNSLADEGSLASLSASDLKLFEDAQFLLWQVLQNLNDLNKSQIATAREFGVQI